MNQDAATVVIGDDIGVGMDLRDGAADRCQGADVIATSTVRDDRYSRTDDPAGEHGVGNIVESNDDAGHR